MIVHLDDEEDTDSSLYIQVVMGHPTTPSPRTGTTPARHPRTTRTVVAEADRDMIMRDNTVTLTRRCWTTSAPRTRTTTTTRPRTTRDCWTTPSPCTRTTTTACPRTTRTEGIGRKPPLSAANSMQRPEYMDNITATSPRSCWTTSTPWTRTTPTTCPGTTRNCRSASTPRTNQDGRNRSQAASRCCQPDAEAGTSSSTGRRG